jgi:hypothetical protein
MARVQQVQKANKNKQTKEVKSKDQPVSKQELAKTNKKREPSKNEILFFRAGMFVIALTLVTVVIVFTIQYFMNQDEEPGVFEDYISITADDLTYLMGYDANSGVYGDFTYFQGKEDYEDLFDLINQNSEIHIYFYTSTALNDEIVDLIKETDFEGKAFFLVDLATEASKLEGAGYSHLNLDLAKENLLLTFNVELQIFEVEVRVSDILRELPRI